MRIAAFGIHHETNTFSTFQVDLQAFQSSGLQREGILRGDQIRELHGDTDTCFGGYFEAAEKHGFELVPLLFAATDPAGTISSEAFESILGEALQMLADQGPWDGVILNQMGAAVTEEFPDMDGEVARRTREQIGPDIPLIMTLDLHANVSQQMADETDALFIYRTNPHLDARPLAVKACEILIRIINGEISPVSALEMPPMVIGIKKQDTSEEPMRQVIDAVVEAESFPDIVDTSTGQGYPWSDVHECGTAFYALADGNPEAAHNAARFMAQRAWSLRHELGAEDGPTPAEAVTEALATPEGPVLLLDAGDNIGAGSAGDSTFILHEALKQGATSYLTTLRDTDAVAQCVDAGIDANITLEVGGKQDTLHDTPVEVTGKIVTISDGKFEDPKPVHAGWRYFDGGTTVVLQTTAGPIIVLVSTRVGNMSRQQFYSVGLNPESFHVIVAKGVVSPRPAFQPIAKKMIVVNTPGATSAALSSFNYKRRRRPLFPFEPQATYPVTENERYVFSDTELAEERLRLLAEVFEPTTRRFIQDAVRAPADLVIDLGCGPGNTTRLLADAIKAKRVIGLDVSDAFITRGRGRETEQVSFGIHDATVTPFPCGPADVIFARYLLTHLGDPFPIVSKWSTQLNAGGLLLLEEMDAIESSNNAVTDYIGIVKKMMAAQGDDLFVGNGLAGMDDSIGIKLLFNRNMSLRIPLQRAATLFGANIKVWRDREYITQNYSDREIDLIESTLLLLAADPSTDEHVQWTMRQVAFRNT